jgi:hypothetical protein
MRPDASRMISKHKDEACNGALQALQDKKKVYFKSKKTKRCWSHSSTVRASITMNLFHKVRQ